MNITYPHIHVVVSQGIIMSRFGFAYSLSSARCSFGHSLGLHQRYYMQFHFIISVIREVEPIYGRSNTRPQL